MLFEFSFCQQKYLTEFTYKFIKEETVVVFLVNVVPLLIFKLIKVVAANFTWSSAEISLYMKKNSYGCTH